MPKHPVALYSELTDEELLACNPLLRQLQASIILGDPPIGDLYIGVNFDIHLIQRRAGYVANLCGGIRHMILSKGYY